MRSSILILLFISSSIFAQEYAKNNRVQKSEFSFFGQKEASHISFFQTDKIQSTKKNYSPINYFGQAAVGSGLSLVFAIIPATISFGYAWENDETNFIGTSLSIITLWSYLLGAATGVYWVAGVENKTLSYWKTVGYSVIGGGAGVVLLAILAENYHNIPSFGGYLVAFSPVIGAMFYASIISDFKPSAIENIQIKKIDSHQDLIDSKSFKINFVRISF